MLIWRYDEGYVVDSETGVVIEKIVEETPYPGNDEAKPYVGTSTGLDTFKGSEIIIEKMKLKGLKDEKGTFITYKLGLSRKSINSLKKKNLTISNLDSEFEDEIERWLAMINKDPILASRTPRVKRALAAVMAARSLGRDLSTSKIAKMFGVNERHLRRLVALSNKRIDVLY